MRIALCQLDPTVGAFDANVDRLLAALAEARTQGADLAIAPELYLCGYPPLDLLNLGAFRAQHQAALARLAREAPPELPLLVGVIAENPEAARTGGRDLMNAVALVHEGTHRICATKTLLPTYDVFDEARYFAPCPDPAQNVVEVKGRRVAVTVCEDIWNDRTYWPRRLYAFDPVERLASVGADVIVNLSASPYHEGKGEERLAMLAATARRHGVPVVYVNQVGGQTGVIFDGRSVAVAPPREGAAPGEAPRLFCTPVAFREAVTVVDLASAPEALPEPARPEIVDMGEALVYGIRGYFHKLGFQSAVIGLSGGIDSALTCALAVRALGAENVVGISMPSPYSSEHSIADAYALGENLGVAVHKVPITPMFEAYRGALAGVFAGKPEDVTEENLQARIRGAILMAFSNKHGHLVLATGNKSELSVGFTTLYGDSCGGLAVIADLWKQEVYALARWLNEDAGRPWIPAGSIEKPPSPELRPGQLDEHALPPYPVLDPLMKALVEGEASAEEAAAAAGVDVALARRFEGLLMRSEYKRFQFPPTLRVSRRAWVGRRYPIVQRFGGS